jgi:hypothetical protein
VCTEVPRAVLVKDRMDSFLKIPAMNNRIQFQRKENHRKTQLPASFHPDFLSRIIDSSASPGHLILQT